MPGYPLRKEIACYPTNPPGWIKAMRMATLPPDRLILFIQDTEYTVEPDLDIYSSSLIIKKLLKSL
jgi:hypothetical protein